jgi:DNA-binding NtrC family response regulator
MNDMARQKTILAIDDDEDFLDVVRDFFGDHYTVETATSGAQALKVFARRRPDLVMLDVSLSGMSGIDVLKRLRALDADVPIVMVTANRDAKIAASCMAEGAYGYVPKPFELTYMDHIAATVMEQPAAR